MWVNGKREGFSRGKAAGSKLNIGTHTNTPAVRRIGCVCILTSQFSDVAVPFLDSHGRTSCGDPTTSPASTESVIRQGVTGRRPAGYLPPFMSQENARHSHRAVLLCKCKGRRKGCVCAGVCVAFQGIHSGFPERASFIILQTSPPNSSQNPDR